jgi:lactoylglutathione lyase
MKLGWVTIRVDDTDASLHFYHDILGLPVAVRHSRPGHDMVMLGEADQPKVELLKTPDSKAAPGAGMSIGLFVDSVQETIELLKKNGVAIESGPISPNPGLTFFFVKDPDGYTVQFVEQK